jgi:hypothetical protein
MVGGGGGASRCLRRVSVALFLSFFVRFVTGCQDDQNLAHTRRKGAQDEKKTSHAGRRKISRDVPCGGAMHMLQRACPSTELDLPLRLTKHWWGTCIANESTWVTDGPMRCRHGTSIMVAGGLVCSFFARRTGDVRLWPRWRWCWVWYSSECCTSVLLGLQRMNNDGFSVEESHHGGGRCQRRS